MNIIGIDFETYYDREYSLSKMTTMEYIMDDRFEVILVGTYFDGEYEWFSGTFEETARHLATFPWNDAVAYAHNAVFDFGILAHRFNIHPKLMQCTRMLAMAIDAPFCKSVSLAALAKRHGLLDKGLQVAHNIGRRRGDLADHELNDYAKYCLHDVELCTALLKKYIPLAPTNARTYIHLTLRKFTKPQIVLDRGELAGHLADTLAYKAKLLTDAGLEPEEAGRKQVQSAAKFAQLLSNLGVDPPTKKSLSTGRLIYAFAKTDQGMKDLLDHPNHDVQILAAARLGIKSTIEETRTQRLLRQCEISDKLAVPLLYFGTKTGRLTGQDSLNLLNIPVGRIRKAMRAGPGNKILVMDLAQIEARILATLAEQWDLVDDFEQGKDPYVRFAARHYGIPMGDVTEKQRKLGKVAILGLGYAMGWKKFGITANNWGAPVGADESENVVNTYRSTYHAVPRLWKLAEQCIRFMMSDPSAPYQMGPITFMKECLVLPNATTLRYPALHEIGETHGGGYEYTYRGRPARLYGGKLVENICQALAGVILMAIEELLAKHGLFAAMQVYDELVFVVPESDAEKVATWIRNTVNQLRVPWMPLLPLKCDVSYADNYLEASP